MGQSVLDASIQQRIRKNGIANMDGDQELVDHIGTCVGCAITFCDEHTHIERTIEEMSDTDPPQFVKEACQSTY